ncbi:MAG: hypothetical protein H6735_12895 [Alphaproteobacteria bacterium]|nr:hypothetical protein [Alphaproteobacteria bacterium]
MSTTLSLLPYLPLVRLYGWVCVVSGVAFGIWQAWTAPGPSAWLVLVGTTSFGIAVLWWERGLRTQQADALDQHLQAIGGPIRAAWNEEGIAGC